MAAKRAKSAKKTRTKSVRPAARAASRTARKAAPRPAARRKSAAPRKTPAKRAARTNGAGAPAAPVAQLARIAKGKKPQYFSDPAIDKLLWTTLTLAQELAVTRDRLDAVERLLADRKVLKAGAVDAYVPPPAVEAARETARTAYIRRFMRAVEAELQETTRRARDTGPAPEEAYEAVSA